MFSTKQPETMLLVGLLLASAVFLGGISCIFFCVKGNIVRLKHYAVPILLSTVVFAFVFESLLQSNAIYDYYTNDEPQFFPNDNYLVDNSVIHVDPKFIVKVNSNIESRHHPKNETTDAEPKFIHFIKTRFMQKQPNLIKLGKARIELFETFCLPSMINQTNKDFFWYIQTDPDLSDELLEPMKKLLAPYSDRFFLLLQNGYGDPRELDVDKITVASGNVDILRQAILDSKQKIVLDTRLDADDGLNVNFIEKLRTQVQSTYRPRRMERRKYWRIFCSTRILNWYFGDLTREDARIMSSPDGYLEDDGTSTQLGCITPGLTFVLPPNVVGPPAMPHHNIRKLVKSCESSRYENCRQDYKDDWFQAFRARTPSSAGMLEVRLNLQDMNFGGSELWNSALNDFNIQKSRVQSARQYFDVHMAEIAQENLDGQCTHGHSCKSSSRNRLKRIVKEHSGVESEHQSNDEKMDNEPKFMHFIKTRFMQHQPNLIKLGKARVELFETFCLPSMINQTNNDFFWYIQTDPDLSDEILLPMKKLLAPYSDRFFLLLKNGHHNPRHLDVDNITVASGNVDSLRQAVLDSQHKIVLETRLDADDGLNVNFIERMRNEVNTIFEDDEWRDYWRIFCPRRILNWYFGDLTSAMPQGNETQGGARIMSSPDGYLEDDGHSTQQLCITPGLTYVLPPNVVRGRLAHHKIRRRLKPCQQNVYENCRQDYSDDWFQSFRARTPSSAGMYGINLELRGMKFGGSNLWKSVVNDFNVQKSRIQSLRRYFDIHMAEIAQENLDGQCIRGFTCKGGTSDALKNIVAANSNVENDNQPKDEAADEARDALTNIVGENSRVESSYQPKNETTHAEPKFIHFIKTRFMQQQPNLIKLGKARIELFETFCLPSMINQTNKDFFWYIQTDPDLSDEILLPMKKLLAPYSDRFFLLLQNGYGDPRELDVDKITVASGNVDILRQAVLDSKQKIMLETRLDADDGLNVNFIEKLRTQVQSIYRPRRMERRKYWRVFCPRRILNWHFGDLTSSMPHGNETHGGARIMSSPDGYLEDDRKSTQSACITPGLTFVLPPNIGQPALAHDKIRRKVKPCEKGIYENCRQDYKDDWFQSFRARTPSSAGMSGIHLNLKDMNFGGSELWNSALNDFNVQKSRVQSARQYFDLHMAEIAQENLDGQCIYGFTCKSSSRNKLQRIVTTISNNETMDA